MKNFRLEPFETDDLCAIEIVGQIERSGEILSIEYQLLGNLNTIAIDPLSAIPVRKFHLWEATCFEFFVGIPGMSNYWEFNLSPTGDWNIFHIDNYRQGLRDELAFSALPFKIEHGESEFFLGLAFDLSQIISVEQQIEVSITTVIKSSQSEISYWALTHCGTEADFHQRDSFILKL